MITMLVKSTSFELHKISERLDINEDSNNSAYIN